MYYIDVICHKTKGLTVVDKTIKMNNRMGESFNLDDWAEFQKELTVKSLIEYMEQKAFGLIESPNKRFKYDRDRRDDAIIALANILPELWDSELFFKVEVYEFTA